MKKKSTIYRLVKALLIHLMLISVVTVAGVFGAAKVVENVLIREALNGEAAFFWAEYEKDSDFALPKTMNLTGYFEHESDDFPKKLLTMTEDFQRVNLNFKNPIVYRTEKYNKTLYLVFEEAQVSKLALYFGIAPLVLVLLVIYLPAFVSFFLAKRAVSPLLKVVKKIQKINISKKGLESVNFADLEDQGNIEVQSLIDTFALFSSKIASFIERERSFSRYASHELRTPLAVFKVSLASLKKQNIDERSLTIINRMEPVVDDMSKLIESLLLLSREEPVKTKIDSIELNALIHQVTEDVTCVMAEREIEVVEIHNNRLMAAVSEQVFQIVISNLIRNAIGYSEPGKKVLVSVSGNQLKIKDHGIGMPESELEKICQPFYRANEFSDTKGFGLGLAIVDWLCQQQGWDLTFESEAGKGTTAILTIHNGQVIEDED